MTDYNFLNLSPYEFEGLTRDLLQKHLDCHIESFANGVDKGIDLRCSLLGNTIIQCKRYKDFNSLFSVLKNEVIKTQKLTPNRYILVTSVELNPERKNKIYNLFSPYIISEEDILGKEDMNNLLAKYPEIESQHFKLWLSSINVLQQIIDRNIINHSQFILEDIKDKIKIYVQNESYYEAKDILQEHKYVIISGIPGIGKTTLAEMIVYTLLANGVEDFIFLSDSIESGYKMYNDAKSQVFLFDDFLGRNFLENTLNRNEEAAIIKFINKIQHSKNKFLVFTTREYILNQAKIKYDLLDEENFQKCILDLSKYTKLAKAKILYNHLFFYETPYVYVSNLSKKNLLFKILEHRNYNPRIIEAFTKKSIWKDISPEEYPLKIYNLLENPQLIWQHAFEHAITQQSRIIMYVFLMLGEHIEYKILYNEVQKFIANYGIYYSINIDDLSFKNSIKELEDSFITINKGNNGLRFIQHQNPSIQDFIVYYTNENEILKSQLINSATYLNLLLRIFSDNEDYSNKNKLSLSKELVMLLVGRIINDFDKFIVYDSFHFLRKSNDDIIIEKLHSIQLYLNLTAKITLKKFFIDKLSSVIYSNTIKYSKSNFITLLNDYNEELFIAVDKVLDNLVNVIDDYDDLLGLSCFSEIDEKAYNKYIESNRDKFYGMVHNTVSNLIDLTDRDNWGETIEMINEISSKFIVNFDDEKEELEYKFSEERYEDDNHYWNDGNSKVEGYPSEDEIIENLFESYQ